MINEESFLGKFSFSREIEISNLLFQFSNNVVPIFKQATLFGEKTALRDMHGDYTYRGLFLSARQFANELTELLGEAQQERIAFLMPNDASYVIVQWACWISGQIGTIFNLISYKSKFK